MAESSRSKVTITLGRNRQVVKKAGPELDNSFGDSESTVGRKRSVLDRLGGNIDSSTNKRARGDGSALSMSASNFIDDTSLDKDDLRFKIMRKTMCKKTQSDSQPSGLDLRDVLSRPAQSSTTTVGARPHMPERKDAKQHFLEPRDDRQYVSELRDPRLRMPEVRDSRQQVPEVRDGRQYVSSLRNPRLPMAEIGDSRQHIVETRDTRQHTVETRDGRRHTVEVRDSRLPVPEIRDGRRHLAESRDSRQHMTEFRGNGQRITEVRDSRQHMAEVRHNRQHSPERKDIRHHMPESYSLSITGRIPSPAVAGSLSHIDPLKSSYSPWSLERLRRRSPDGVASSSRGFSPPRREEEFQRRPSMRSYDDIRVGSYMRKDVMEFSRPLTSASYSTTAALPAVPSKLMAPSLAPPMPPGSLLQKSSYPVDDQHTVDSFLYSLGLQKFAINFKAEEVCRFPNAPKPLSPEHFVGPAAPPGLSLADLFDVLDEMEHLRFSMSLKVDMYALKQMGESDLKDLGIPMGPRKKILLALQPRPKRPV